MLPKIGYKVIQWDIVILFKSLSFAWTALSGFQSTGIPIFAQAAFSGFRLAGCTDTDLSQDDLTPVYQEVL
ncbi:hypothetical protein, partial [Pseudomonas syringae]|uniref:hypothetical protein n=1 Tax=Pseudomonas syringae TaxID=317 RepID=UPI000517AA79